MKKTYFFFILLFSLATNALLAQQYSTLYNAIPDSIKPINKNKWSSIEKRKVLNRYLYFAIDSLYSHDLNLIALSLELENYTGDIDTQIKNLDALSYYYCSKGDVDKAIFFYNKLIGFNKCKNRTSNNNSKSYYSVGFYLLSSS